jgi:hypothetical protein
MAGQNRGRHLKEPPASPAAVKINGLRQPRGAPNIDGISIPSRKKIEKYSTQSRRRPRGQS